MLLTLKEWLNQEPGARQMWAKCQKIDSVAIQWLWPWIPNKPSCQDRWTSAEMCGCLYSRGIHTAWLEAGAMLTDNWFKCPLQGKKTLFSVERWSCFSPFYTSAVVVVTWPDALVQTGNTFVFSLSSPALINRTCVLVQKELFAVVSLSMQDEWCTNVNLLPYYHSSSPYWQLVIPHHWPWSVGKSCSQL